MLRIFVVQWQEMQILRSLLCEDSAEVLAKWFTKDCISEISRYCKQIYACVKLHILLIKVHTFKKEPKDC